MLNLRALHLVSWTVVALSVAPAVASQTAPSISSGRSAWSAPPSARQPGGTRAPLRLYQANLASHPLTPLATAGVPIAQSVAYFIERVSLSTPGEREQIRTLIARGSNNDDVARALTSSAFESRTRDYTRTLTALSILGELRHPIATAALWKFVALPLPASGHVIEGELSERATLEKLQMKAVDGLAYARTQAADRTVLQIAGMHPSRAVRAEAISAYLYNHQNTVAARNELLQVVKRDERVFIDRPTYAPGINGAVFNAQLAGYLRLHPELRAPAMPLQRDNATGVARDKEKVAHTTMPRPRSEPPALLWP